MQYAVRFGRAGIVIPKLFAWLDDEGGGAVQVFSDQSGVIALVGEERARFIRFVERRSEDSEDIRPSIQAAEVVRGDFGAPQAGEGTKRSAP